MTEKIITSKRNTKKLVILLKRQRVVITIQYNPYPLSNLKQIKLIITFFFQKFHTINLFKFQTNNIIIHDINLVYILTDVAKSSFKQTIR